MRLSLRGEAPSLPLVNLVRVHSIAVLKVLPETHQLLLGPQCDLTPLEVVLDLVLAASHQQVLRVLALTLR